MLVTPSVELQMIAHSGVVLTEEKGRGRRVSERQVVALVQKVSRQSLTTAHVWLRMDFSPFILTSSKNREDLGS